MRKDEIFELDNNEYLKNILSQKYEEHCKKGNTQPVWLFRKSSEPRMVTFLLYHPEGKEIKYLRLAIQQEGPGLYKWVAFRKDVEITEFKKNSDNKLVDFFSFDNLGRLPDVKKFIEKDFLKNEQIKLNLREALQLVPQKQRKRKSKNPEATKDNQELSFFKPDGVIIHGGEGSPGIPTNPEPSQR